VIYVHGGRPLRPSCEKDVVPPLIEKTKLQAKGKECSAGDERLNRKARLF